MQAMNPQKPASKPKPGKVEKHARSTDGGGYAFSKPSKGKAAASTSSRW